MAKEIVRCYHCGAEMKEHIWVNQEGNVIGTPFHECPNCGIRQ